MSLSENWKKDYPSAQNITEESLDENHSLKKMLRLVGENKRVIDFGCATGYFSQLLTRKGCRVTGIEINPEAAKVAEIYCEKVIVADLDFVSLAEILPIHEFDVAVFGDVLEHLRNPWKVLEETQQLLKSEGYIVASIPNIAHGAIRLALLQGRFEYTELGILDNTHLRFFTRKTVEELFERAGYFIDVIDCTKLPVLSDSPLVPNIDKNNFDAEIWRQLEKQEGVDDLQFVVRAFSLSEEGKKAAFNERYKLIYQLDHSQSQLHQTQAELERSLEEAARSQSQMQHTHSELEQSLGQATQSQSQLHQTQAELNKLQAQQQQTQAELERSLAQQQQTQAELERSLAQQQQTQAELERSLAQQQQTQAELERSLAQQQHTQAELEQSLGQATRSLSQLQQAQAELEQSRVQLQQIQAKEERSLSQLQHTQAEFGQTQSQLQHTQAELEQTQSQLQHTQAELVQSQAIITGMESSKFWKLRTAWFRVKRTIGLPDNSPPTSSAGSSSLLITDSPAGSSPPTDSSSLQITDSPAGENIPGVNNLREINLKAALKNSPNGHFDGINGFSVKTIEVPQATPLTAGGWAIIADEGRPADSVIITSGDNNSLVAVAPVTLERPDVLKATKNPAYKKSGWSATFNSSTLPVGKVVIKAWAYNSARQEATQLNFTPTVEVLPASYEDPYHRWLSKNSPREADLRKMAEVVEILSYKPVISIIMPVFNTPEQFLREAIESVLNQVYPYWELCIADDASTKSYVRSILEEYISSEPRIKVVFRNENGHISRASNSAIEIATGEFIALLDHDDLLTPDALYELALLLNRHPEADMIYSDEDKVDEHNQIKDPFFKPDWCPDSFLSRMYTCHLGIYRRSLVTAIKGFRVGYEGSQDYDLVLRFTEKTEKIFHIPKILYHWRVHPKSASSGSDAKPYAYIAAEKALADALLRRGENAIVSGVPGYLGLYSVRYNITDYKLVSIIIPTKDLGETLDKCLTSIFTKTVYPNYEVVVIDNGSEEEYTANVINRWQNKESSRFKCYKLDIPFNFSKINNYAVNQAKGEYLLLLNNDIEVISSDWIDAMVEQAQRPSIGAVGALLLYPDNFIQHAGIVLGIGGVGSHSHKHFPSELPGYGGQVITINNYSAVTAACLMCRREVYESVAGFEEELAVAYNDVDFCLKLVQLGYRNIYLPHVVLYHHESRSRGSEDTAEKLARLVKEAEYMQKKWNNLLKNDPCYNPNLTRTGDDYSINI